MSDDDQVIQLDVDEFCASEEKEVDISYDQVSELSSDHESVDYYIVDESEKEVSLDNISSDEFSTNGDIFVTIGNTGNDSEEDCEREVSYKMFDQVSNCSEIEETRTVKIVKDLTVCDSPVFACSDFIPNGSEKNEIVNVSLNGDLNKVITQICQVGKLNRDVWLSLSRKTSLINPKPFSVAPQKCMWTELKRKKVLEITSTIEELNKIVTRDGGRLFVLTLLPCPSLIDPDTSIFSNEFQELNSQVFIKINKEIERLNKLHGRDGTVHINRYVEVKRRRSSGKSTEIRRKKIIEHKTSDYYKGRDQRKINEKKYEKDRDTLKQDTIKELTDTIHKAISEEKKKIKK